MEAAAIGRTIREVADTVGAGVVGIGAGWGVGSGTVIGEGLVLTNAHNVRSDEVALRFADGRTAPATLVARDVDGDLAVLAADTAGTAAPAWAELPAALQLGMPVLALANPGGHGLRVTVGFVSSVDRHFRGPRGRRITGAVEHTAPMARGSSGGPLFDPDGRFVGVNTHRLGGGFYLALPAGTALREQVDALARGEAPQRRRLGIALAPDGAARALRTAVGLPERDGVLVHAVEEGSPADRAGVRRGDLLVAAGGRDLARADDLLAAVDGADAALALTLVRGADTAAVTVELAEEDR